MHGWLNSYLLQFVFKGYCCMYVLWYQDREFLVLFLDQTLINRASDSGKDQVLEIQS